MNQAELKTQIDSAIASINDEMLPTPGKPKQTDADRKMAALTMIGMALFGELLMDIKRIADAAESYAKRN